ncbi:MAG: superoxide dismutase family protein [Humidesulfovibrio sp.]|nr:superoxide dismutase family protein [Humidesulfovibrio sp.]
MRHSILLTLTLLSLSACAFKAPSAEAVLKPASGNSAAGSVSFAMRGKSVLIKGRFTGLTPGAHGFNIHERGDCASPGGHFNPLGKRHGDLSQPDHHAGDLPMVVAGASGQAHFEALMNGLSLDDGPLNILGRSIVVHARPDNFTTQPTGNSGPGVACGVITAQ